jgi:hypothetical protein
LAATSNPAAAAVHSASPTKSSAVPGTLARRCAPGYQTGRGARGAVHAEVGRRNPGELRADDRTVGHCAPRHHHLAEQPEQDGVERRESDAVEHRRNRDLANAEAGRPLCERADQKARGVELFATPFRSDRCRIVCRAMLRDHLAEE